MRLACHGLGNAHILENLDQRRSTAIHLVTMAKLAQFVAPECVALALFCDAYAVAGARALYVFVVNMHVMCAALRFCRQGHAKFAGLHAHLHAYGSVQTTHSANAA